MSSDPLANKSQAWSALFSEPMSELVKRYTASVDFDKRLWRADIEGSLAHAEMLAAQGIIGAQDLADRGEQLAAGLVAVEVVDHLELVDVEHEDRQREAVALAARLLDLEALARHRGSLLEIAAKGRSLPIPMACTCFALSPWETR